MNAPQAFDYATVHAAQAQWAANRYRSQFPAAAFRLIRKTEHDYVIAVDDPADASPEAVAHFNQHIKPVSAPVRLSGDCLDGVDVALLDASAFTGGLPGTMTVLELEDRLIADHADLKILRIEQDSASLALTVWLAPEASTLDLAPLKADLAAFGLRDHAVTVRYGSAEPHAEADLNALGNVARIVRRSMRHPRIRALPHVREDDERWRSEIGRAAEGQLDPSAIISRPDDQRSVLIPSVTLSALPNIRNYLLTYDNVILEVPLSDRYEASALTHQFDADDIAEAAQRGRIRLLVTQPEERLPLRLLETVSERAPNAIIGRRAGSAYALAVLRKRMDQFRRQWPNAEKDARTLAIDLKPDLGDNQAAIERLLLEPLSTYHAALGALAGHDLKALPSLTGDDAWSIAKHILRPEAGQDLSFEFMVANMQMAMANVFQAELTVSAEQHYLHLPSHLLGVIHTMTDRRLAQTMMDDDLDTGSLPRWFINPATPIFEFSEIRPLSSLLDVVTAADAVVAKSILSDLASLPKEQRHARIIELTDIVSSFGARPSNAIIGDGMGPQYARLVAQIVGPFISILGPILGVLQAGDNIWAWFRTANRIKQLGDDVSRSRRQVELLRRMRPVAWLSQKRG